MKIWILEGYIDAERMQKDLEDAKQMLEAFEEKGDRDGAKMAEQMIENWKKRIEETPDGYWLGYQGKSDYKTFCRMAQETLRNPYLREMKFRVVKADLKDPKAKFWLNNYENGVENPGVLRYLYATL